MSCQWTLDSSLLMYLTSSPAASLTPVLFAVLETPVQHMHLLLHLVQGFHCVPYCVRALYQHDGPVTGNHACWQAE